MFHRSHSPLFLFSLFVVVGLVTGCTEGQIDNLTPTPKTLAYRGSCPRLPHIEYSSQPSAPLTPQEQQNLETFARLYGVVRNFYPADEVEQVDWDRFAVIGVLGVMDAPDTSALATRLNAIFCPLAPTVRVLAPGETGEPSVFLTTTAEGAEQVVMWEHQGGHWENPIQCTRVNGRMAISKTALCRRVSMIPALPIRLI